VSRTDDIRAELAAVGTDEFCARRYKREDMPVRLMRALSKSPVLNARQIGRRGKSAGELGWTDVRLSTLRMMAEGKLDKEIAHEDGVSIWTVKTRVMQIYALLDADNRAHAVAIAIRTGVIQ
jgi:DNA-binding CsgD family transcriptional regulator